MTAWSATVGNALDCEADALICSANPSLSLSGGVGGELLLRYGQTMQDFLREWLKRSQLPCVVPGSVVVAPGGGSPFRVVIHAVAIDAFYDTSAAIIAKAYSAAFAEAVTIGCKSIASACLACGYGRASPGVFLAGIRPHVRSALVGVSRVEFRSTDAAIISAIQAELRTRNSEPRNAADSQ